MMFHQSDIVEVVLLRQEHIIGIDMEGIAGKALEQVDIVVGIDNLLKAFRDMLQGRAGFIFVPHPMKTQMNVAEHVCPHVVVQKL